MRAVAATAALIVLPKDADALAAWERATPGWGPQPTSPLSATQRATLARIADAILPRTDSPSATDVGVPAWIDVIVADYYTADERTAMLTGLDAIDALSRERTGQPVTALDAAALDALMQALDAPADRTAPAARGYQRLKGLVVHGYFTSERVQRDVLHTDIMPGRFVGNAPMPTRNGAGRDA